MSLTCWTTGETSPGKHQQPSVQRTNYLPTLTARIHTSIVKKPRLGWWVIDLFFDCEYCTCPTRTSTTTTTTTTTSTTTATATTNTKHCGIQKTWVHIPLDLEPRTRALDSIFEHTTTLRQHYFTSLLPTDFHTTKHQSPVPHPLTKGNLQYLGRAVSQQLRAP